MDKPLIPMFGLGTCPLALVPRAHGSPGAAPPPLRQALAGEDG